MLNGQEQQLEESIFSWGTDQPVSVEFWNRRTDLFSKTLNKKAQFLFRTWNINQVCKVSFSVELSKHAFQEVYSITTINSTNTGILYWSLIQALIAAILLAVGKAHHVRSVSREEKD